MEAQVAANRPQTSQLHQLQQSNPANVDVLRQMMLGQQQAGINSVSAESVDLNKCPL